MLDQSVTQNSSSTQDDNGNIVPRNGENTEESTISYLGSLTVHFVEQDGQYQAGVVFPEDLPEWVKLKYVSLAAQYFTELQAWVSEEAAAVQ